MTQEKKRPPRRNIPRLLGRRINSIFHANQRATTQSRRRFTTAGSRLRGREVPPLPRPTQPGRVAAPAPVKKAVAAGRADTSAPSEQVTTPSSPGSDFRLPLDTQPYISFLTAQPDSGHFDSGQGSADSGTALSAQEILTQPAYNPDTDGNGFEPEHVQPIRRRRRRLSVAMPPIRNRRIFAVFAVLAVLLFAGLIFGLLSFSRLFQPTSPQKFTAYFARFGEGKDYNSGPNATQFTQSLSDNYIKSSGIPEAQLQNTSSVIKNVEGIAPEMKRSDSDVGIWGYYDPDGKRLNLTLSLKPNGPFDIPDGMGYKENQRRLYDPDVLAFVTAPPTEAPNSRQPLTVLLSGLYSYYSGGYEQAVAEFTTLIRASDPVNLPAMRLLRGNALFAYNKYNDAVEEYDKLLALIIDTTGRGGTPPIDPAFVLNNRAVALSNMLGKSGEARADLEDALKRRNDLSRSMVNYASLQLDQPGLVLSTEQLNQTIKMLENAAKLDPKMPGAYYYLGRAYNRLGNLSKALENFQKAEDYDNLQPGVYREHGFAQIESAKEQLVEPARQQFQTALDLAQRQGQQSRDQATRLLSQNLTEQGRVWQNRAAFLDNVTIDARYGLARAYYEKGWREGNTVGNPFDKALRWAQNKKTSLEEARDRLLEVIAARPNFAEPHLYLSLTYALLGEGDANGEFNKARQLEKDPAALLRFTQTQANFLLRQGRPNDAVVLYTEYLRQNPANYQAHLALAKLYNQLGQYDKGLASAQQAVKLNPNEAEVYLVTGQAQLGLNQPEPALASLDRAVKIKNISPEVQMQRGNALLALKRPTEAEAAYKLVLATDNTAFPDAHYQLGVIYMDYPPNDLNRAREQFETAIKQKPDYVQAHFRLAQLYSRNNATLNQAITSYGEVIKYDSRNANAYYLRGLLLETKGQTKEAETDYKRALELEPGLFSARSEYAEALLKSGKLAEGLKEAQTVAQQNKNSAEAQNTLGDAYRLSGDYNQAVTAYTEALRLKANYIDALYGRAVAYYNVQKYDVGIVDIEKVVSVDSKYNGALVLRSQYLTQRNNYDEALKSLEQARQNNANDPAIYSSLGVIYLRRNQSDQAAEAFNQSLKLDPNRVESHFWLGALYNGRNDHDKAIAEYERTVQLQPEWALAWLYLGQQYADKGEADTAIQKFDVAIQKDSRLLEAFYQRGNAYRSKNSRAKAQADYDAALALNNKYAPALLQKAITYEEVGDGANARKYYKSALDNAQPAETAIKEEAQRSITRLGG